MANKSNKKLFRILITSIFFAFAFSMLISYLTIMSLKHFNINNTTIGSVIIVFSWFAFSALIGVGVACGISYRAEIDEEHINEYVKEICQGNFEATPPNCKRESNKQMIENIQRILQEIKNQEIYRKDFITNFSHEFKTPIVSINGFAEILLNKKLSVQEKKEYLQIIYDESLKLSKMSQNILLLSNLENKEIVSNEIFNLKDQIQSCLSVFKKELENKNIKIISSIDNLSYNGNSELIRHIWMNLISNAIKFSNNDSRINVTLCLIDDKINFIIQDFGKGINKETQEHIFDKFYQGDKSHYLSGNGLGLSIVKKIVDKHQGKIEINSEIDKGTTFKIIL